MPNPPIPPPAVAGARGLWTIMTEKPPDGDFGDGAGQQPGPNTRLVLGGRGPFSYHGFVNPPVYHASTMLYPTASDMVARRARYEYGRRGTPTSDALEAAIGDIEGPDCAGIALLPSGAAAIST